MASMPGTYRICVLIDIVADDASDAYGAVYNIMKDAEDQSAENPDATTAIEGWETADEDWFGPGGHELTFEQIRNARRMFFCSTPAGVMPKARGY